MQPFVIAAVRAYIAERPIAFSDGEAFSAPSHARRALQRAIVSVRRVVARFSLATNEVSLRHQGRGTRGSLTPPGASTPEPRTSRGRGSSLSGVLWYPNS